MELTIKSLFNEAHTSKTFLIAIRIVLPPPVLKLCVCTQKVSSKLRNETLPNELKV